MNRVRGRDGAVIALAAIGVRVLHLVLGRADPTWSLPIIDAGTYRDLAAGIAAHGTLPATLIWQPVLYPLGLAFVFKLLGPSVVAARIVQIGLGTLTCLVTWRLAERWFGRRVALTAGLLVALCGPLVFFESVLVAAGPAALVGVLLVLVADEAARTPRWWPPLALGLTGVVAIYLRPTFLPAVVGLVVWLAVAGVGSGRKRAAVVALTVLAIAVPVQLVTRARFGHGALLPTSGSLNLYLGNNADPDRSIAIRPGLDWDRLIAAPRAAGYGAGAAAGERYYRDRVLAYLRHSPGAFVAGLGRKTLQLLCSRELPRNQDVYLHRRWSPVLKVLVFKLGRWGLPAGVLLPLAVFGLVVAGGRRQVPAVILLVGVGASLVLVFVAARYRAPLWPLVAVFAAAGLHHLSALRRLGRDRRVLVATAAACLVLLLGTLPGPFAQEKKDLRGELEFAVGHALYQRQDWSEAARHLDAAIALDPDQVSAHNFLAICLAKTGQLDAAAQQWNAALALAPDYADAASNLAQVNRQRAEADYEAGRRVESTDPASALASYRRAMQLVPDWAEPVARAAWLEATSRVDSLRDGSQAVALATRALALQGEHPYLLLVLSVARARAGQWPEAEAAARRGLALATGDQARWRADLQRALKRSLGHETWSE